MATTKTPTGVPADKLALYETLVRTNPNLTRKGAAIPYTSLNGHMFSYLSPTGALYLRLSPTDREEFVRKYKTPPAESYGVIMKEYVTVPDKLLANTKEMKQYFDLSYEYIKSLKPKPTTKKKPAAVKK